LTFIGFLIIFFCVKGYSSVPRSVLQIEYEGDCIAGLYRPKENIVDKGKVKWFNERKGFGFIVPDNGGEDLFIHHSNIAAEGFRSLYDGQAVEFEVAQGKKGPEAVNVQPC
jgi:CspA family cold shock protein